MKWLQTVTIALTFALGCQGVFGQTMGEIGMVGYFLGDGPWADWSGQWLALQERDGGFELREVTVSSKRNENPICGDKGFIVGATSADPGILLLRGFPGIKAGQVVTSFHGRKFLLPGEHLNVSLGSGAYWHLYAFGTVRPPLHDHQYTDYEVWMTGGGREATVFSLERLDGDGLPEILWVGDLDGDRVADIIADVRTHYNLQHPILFLSSLARPGQLVAEAASFVTGGC
jgi:hypothetical protein